MSNGTLEEKNRFAMIGVVMIVISILFLIYMGSSLVSSTKKYLSELQGIEMLCK